MTNPEASLNTGSVDPAVEDSAATCCAMFYEQDIVQQLLGESFHPGGKALSSEMVRRMNLPAGSKVLDVACGIGTTTRMMAKQFCLSATGLDFSHDNVARAQALLPNNVSNAEAPALSLPISENCCESPSSAQCDFIQGSADALPFDDETFEGVTCECAVSTFTDQPRVLREIHRVLKPGGVFAMTDMVVHGTLPDSIAENIAPWTCMAKAHSVAGYQRLALDHGFNALFYSDHSKGLLQLASELKRKLAMVGMGQALGAVTGLELDVPTMRKLIAQSTELVHAQTVQYALLLFSKGCPNENFLAALSVTAPVSPCCVDGC